jgi:hypothetical protein
MSRPWADALRDFFEKIAKRPGPVTVVAILGGLAAGAGALQKSALDKPCGKLPVDVGRFEVTFSSTHHVGRSVSHFLCARGVRPVHLGRALAPVHRR